MIHIFLLEISQRRFDIYIYNMELKSMAELSKLTILEILEKTVEDHDDYLYDINLPSSTKEALKELISPVRILCYWITKELKNDIRH